MALGVLSTLVEWNPQSTHVEREMDSSAYEAAHPDDTLILAGPPRSPFNSTAAGANPLAGMTEAVAKSSYDKSGLFPLGMVQQISFQQSKPTQPLMAVGSGRTFFTSGKAQTAWNAARLWVQGNNLLRALYANGFRGTNTLKPDKFDDPAATSENSTYLLNLDSELFYLPFGMLCIFRDKAHDQLGAFYVEMCMISSWATSVNAGQSQIMEQVSGLADRILPVSVSGLFTEKYVNRSAMDALVGFVAARDTHSGDTLPSSSASMPVVDSAAPPTDN